MTDDEVMALAVDLVLEAQSRADDAFTALSALALAVSVHCEAKIDNGQFLAVTSFDGATAGARGHLIETLVDKRVGG